MVSFKVRALSPRLSLGKQELLIPSLIHHCAAFNFKHQSKTSHTVRISQQNLFVQNTSHRMRMFEVGRDVDTYTMTNVDVNTDINVPCLDLTLCV